MTEPAPPRRLPVVLAYAAVALVATGLIAWLLQLWERDLRVPFMYSGDALDMVAHLKSMLEHGTHMHHPTLGAPGDGLSYDYPMSDPLHFWVMYGLSYFGLEAGTILNTYFVLTFPLTAVAMMFALRCFRVGLGPAAVAGLLYTFLYYHLERGVSHIHLSAYYPVPLMMMVVLWVMQRGSIFFKGAEQRGTRTVAAIVITLVFATATIYYSFFVCYLLVVAGFVAAVGQRSLKPLVTGGLLVAVITGVFVATMLECWEYVDEHGENPTATIRPMSGVETFSMKMTHLLLPVTGHRVGALARLKDHYNANQGFGAPVNECDLASLGLLGSLGFLALLVVVLLPLRPRASADGPASPTLARDLGVLNLALVLLATLGGLGMVFALLVTPLVRSYNRASVLIAFCALFAVALFLDFVRRRFAAAGARAFVFHLLLLGLLAAGLLDQVPKGTSRAKDLEKIQAENERFAINEEFHEKIETLMPEGSLIFQLPHHGFPEEPPPPNLWMITYDQLLAFFHTSGLRWSYGAIKGRGTHDWLQRVAALPGPELVRTIGLAGFTGLWVDRGGYSDPDLEKLEQGLAKVAGGPTFASRKARYHFYDLRKVVEEMRTKAGAAEWDRARLRALPVRPFFDSGFYAREQDAHGTFRWARREAALYFDNPLPIPRRVRLSTKIDGAQKHGNLVIRCGDFEQTVALKPELVAFERVFEIPARSSTVVLKFTCDTHKRVNHEKTVAFRLHEVRLTELTE